MTTPEPSPSPSGLTLAAFVGAVILGGANFLFVRVSNRELPPIWGAGLRFTLAAALFVLIALALRLRWPRGRQLWLTSLYGLLSFAVSYALVYWALVRLTAGVTTVVLAIVPLVTLLLAAAHRLERLHWRAVVGSLLAIAGVGWMFVGPQDLDLPVIPLLAVFVAAVSIGESVILGKRVSGNHPAVVNAVAMTIGAVALLGLSAVVGEQWALPRQPAVVWSLVYLVTLGSVGLFVLILLVVRRWTASATSYAFVLFPVVTMALGAWLADEPLTLDGVVGAVLVMAGVWFGALSPAARRATDIGEPRSPAAVESP
jgi:drug/metabolite transporter (DMT)-like permease